MSLDYRVVVPSRRRTEYMPRLLSLLPDALVCVDQVEHDDYAPRVPRDQLLCHPSLTSLAAIRNWLMQNVDAPIIVMGEDDFQGIRTLVGSPRFITNSDDIAQIIWNSARACADLDLTTFCYSRTANPIFCQPAHYPIEAVHPSYGIFGIMGRARYRYFDESLAPRADLDWSLRTLLEDRAVLCDLRFYCEFGASFGGDGGTVSTAEVFDRVSTEIKRRWGKHVVFRAPAWTEGKQALTASIRVGRTSRAAQR